jgi:hypothetical protein
MVKSKDRRKKNMIRDMIVLVIILVLIYIIKSQYSGENTFSPFEGVMAVLNIKGG